MVPVEAAAEAAEDSAPVDREDPEDFRPLRDPVAEVAEVLAVQEEEAALGEDLEDRAADRPAVSDPAVRWEAAPDHPDLIGLRFLFLLRAARVPSIMVVPAVEVAPEICFPLFLWLFS